MTPEQRVQRAQEARFVLESPAYREAFDRITADIRSLRLQVPPRDIEGISRLVFMEQAVERAKRLMETYIQEGDIALRELKKAAEPNAVVRFGRKLRR